MIKKQKLTFTRLSSNFEVVLPEALTSLKGGGDSDVINEDDPIDLPPVDITPDDDDEDPGEEPMDPEPEEPIEPDEWDQEDQDSLDDFINHEDGGEDTADLTPEQYWAFNHPLEAIMAKLNATRAENAVEQMPGIHNGVGDAFRHAYWMFQNTQDFGSTLALELGQMHEQSSPNGDPEESAMDMHNNTWGANYAAAHEDATLEQFTEAFNTALANGEIELLGPNTGPVATPSN